jgi:hypothetical protein
MQAKGRKIKDHILRHREKAITNIHTFKEGLTNHNNTKENPNESKIMIAENKKTHCTNCNSEITKINISENRTEPLFKKIWNSMLNHFFITFIILLIINIFFISNKSIPLLFEAIVFLLLVAYVIIFLILRIQSNINKLIHHELQFKEIISGYVTSVLFIIILFSILYWGMMLTGTGYLRYGSCIDNLPITDESIIQDPMLVTDIIHYPYFSAISFFAVGYGDICPMGYNKIISIINALIGNAFTVLILAIAITNYSSNKENEDNEVKKKNDKK